MKEIISKKMKEACVLLIAAVMVFSTSAVMANTTEELVAMEFTIGVRGIASLSMDEEGETVSMDGEAIYFYDPSQFPYQAVGVTGCSPPFHWKTAIRLTSDELAQYIGWNVTAVRVFYGELENEHWGDIEIYGEGTPTNPGALITSEPYHFDLQDWFRIDLTNPILIDGTDLWVACAYETNYDEYPAVQDGAPAVDGKGDWGCLNNVWDEMQNVPGGVYDHNWGIEAIVEGESTELSITDPIGPIGVSTSIKNIGENPATNVVYEFTVIGGILGMIQRMRTMLIRYQKQKQHLYLAPLY